jgi:hypothetical protein
MLSPEDALLRKTVLERINALQSTQDQMSSSSFAQFVRVGN